MKEPLVPDPRNYNAQEILKDGTPITIRAVRKDDQTSIRAAFRVLDREAVYSRFFNPKETDLTNAEIQQVTDLDFRQVVALLATVSQGDGEEIVIGDGRYATIKRDKLGHAELAFIVGAVSRTRRCFPPPEASYTHCSTGGPRGLRGGRTCIQCVYACCAPAQRISDLSAARGGYRARDALSHGTRP